MKLSDGLRTVFLAGVGAVAVTGEKAKRLVDDLVKKGELTVEEGKVLNEDITRKMGEKAEKKSIRGVLFDIDKMTQEDRDELMEKIKAANEAALKAAEEAATVVGKAAKTAGDAIFKKENAEAEAECEEAAAECEACEKAEEVLDAAVNEAEEIAAEAEACAEEACDAVKEAVEEIVSEDKDEA